MRQAGWFVICVVVVASLVVAGCGGGGTPTVTPPPPPGPELQPSYDCGTTIITLQGQDTYTLFLSRLAFDIPNTTIEFSGIDQYAAQWNFSGPYTLAGTTLTAPNLPSPTQGTQCPATLSLMLTRSGNTHGISGSWTGNCCWGGQCWPMSGTIAGQAG